jgi:hypothetical protein
MTTSQHESLRVGDRVRERLHQGDRCISSAATAQLVPGPRYGRIVSLESKPDRRGRLRQYANVQWDHLKSPSLHASFRIEVIASAVHSQQ